MTMDSQKRFYQNHNPEHQSYKNKAPREIAEEKIKDMLGRNIGEGELMSADTKTLHRMLIERVPPEHQELILYAGNLSRRIHTKLRKDKETPEVNHVFRVALRGIQRDPNISIEEILIRLFHDANEDYPKKISKNKLKKFFQNNMGESKDRDKMLETVYIGILGMNKMRRKIGPSDMKKKERELRYYEHLEKLHILHPQLHLWRIKFDDRVDCSYGDIAKSVTNRFDENSINSLRKAIEKVNDIRPYVERLEPDLLKELDAAILVGEGFSSIGEEKKSEEGILIVQFPLSTAHEQV